jgi:hypothetical protein
MYRWVHEAAIATNQMKKTKYHAVGIVPNKIEKSYKERHNRYL